MSSSSSLVSSSPLVPITSAHPVADDLDSYVPHSGVPRVFVAPDRDHPNGSEESANSRLSVLQQHVKYFDENDDGVILPWETYDGFRSLGFGIVLSFVAAFLIHSFVSYPTQPNWLPDLRFPIYISRIHCAKHGSDSEVFDNEGRFVPSKFDQIWFSFAKSEPNSLNWQEMWQFVAAMRNAMDFVGMGIAR